VPPIAEPETIIPSTERGLTCPWCKGTVRVDLYCQGKGHGDQGQQLVAITGTVRPHRCKWKKAR